jgi:3-hydroxybutyryl-CoA dehydratase
VTSPIPEPLRGRLRGRSFSSLEIGEELWDALTLTETHVVLAAGIFNDPGGNHINKLQAEASRWGALIVHGPLIAGVMMGVIGNAIGSTTVAMLDLHARWLHPTYVGDTVITCWRVAKKIDKPKFGGGGIVTFEGKAMNDAGDVLVEASSTLAIGEDGPWDPAAHVRRDDERAATGR